LKGSRFREIGFRIMKFLKFSVGSVALLVAIAATTTQASSARAADPQRPESSSTGQPGFVNSVEALNEQGAVLYERGAYRQALEKFIEAYAIDHDSNLLFNVARCYDVLVDLAAATEKYQAFLAGADEENGKRARKALERVARAKQTKSADQTQSTEQEERSLYTSTASSSPSADQSAAHSAARLAPWLVLGGGVLVSAAGVVFLALGAQDHQRITSASGYDDSSAVDVMTEHEARELADSGVTKKTIGALGLGLGGALITTSVILFVLDEPRESRSASVALGVDAAESAATLLLRGAF